MVVCGQCSLEEVRTKYPDMPNLYQLTDHKGEQLVRRVHAVNNREEWRLDPPFFQAKIASLQQESEA